MTWVLERMPSRCTPLDALDQLVLVERAAGGLDLVALRLEPRDRVGMDALEQQDFDLVLCDRGHAHDGAPSPSRRHTRVHCAEHP